MNKKPAIKPVDPGFIPEPEKKLLDNGVPLFTFNAGTEEIVRLEISFPAGSSFEKTPLSATMTNAMLMEGCRGYTALKLNRILDFYGAYNNTYCEKDRAGIVIYSLNRYISKVLDIIKMILSEPVFPASELKSQIKKRMRQFLISREKTNVLANDYFFESVFGKTHPYGRRTVMDDFRDITPEMLTQYHATYYRPENMAIIAAGKIPADLGKMLNRCFGAQKSRTVIPEERNVDISGLDDKKIHIEKSGSVQSSVRIGSGTINKRHPDYPALKILNVILGGYFGSRLMKNLREEKGYTYGVNSSVTSLDLSGYKIISTEVSNKFTHFAIDEIFKEIQKLQLTPVGRDELEMVRNYMLGDMVRMFDGPFALADSFRSVWEFGLDNNYYYRLADKIKTITPDEITEAARTYYNIDKLFQITAG